MINRFINSIMLSAIGDALGWITEFEKSEDSLNKRFGIRRVESYIDWNKNVGGRFNGYVDKIKAGSYSDDTQLLLSVARSIDENGAIKNEYFSKIELPTWLLYARGAGRTIKNAARKIERKSADWNNNFFTYKVGEKKFDYKDSGANGAAMRILPIALANIGRFNKTKENIFRNSIVTHGHPRAIVGAILYGLAIDTIFNYDSDNFSFETYITELGTNLLEKLKLDFIYETRYRVWLAKWNEGREIDFISAYKAAANEVLEFLRYIYKSNKEGRETYHILSELGCYKPETRGSGVSTVIAGIYLAAKNHKKIENAILEAANAFGTDTDSIAAFSGGLLGALSNQDIIPERWKTVQDSSYLMSVGRNLEAISNRESNIIKRDSFSSHILKIINENPFDHFSVNDVIHFTPLGTGEITNIEKQDALTSGRYNIIIDVDFKIGQTCRFAKLLSI